MDPSSPKAPKNGKTTRDRTAWRRTATRIRWLVRWLLGLLPTILKLLELFELLGWLG